ncbi:MAG: HAD family hydrolase [Ancrocorticia sp.]
MRAVDSAKNRYVPGKKLIFLDFDGTLSDWEGVPPGHVRALQELQANGHLVFLCTGRPLSGVNEDVRALGFDGLVCAAGGFVFIDGQILADRRFDQDVATRAVDLLNEHDGIYILESPNHVYVRAEAEAPLRRLFRTHLDMLERLRVRDDLHGVSFSKITVIHSKARIVDLAREIGDAVQALPSSIQDRGESSGEIQPSDVNKAVGIDVVVDYLGADLADTIACGDGLNDVEMLAHAGVGVAVGSDQRVLDVADMAVPGPEKEGLRVAFSELGLI